MKHLKRTAVFFWFLLAICFFMDSTKTSIADSSLDSGSNEMDVNLPGGLLFHLSEGAETVSAPAMLAATPAESLADSDAKHVFDRMPPFAIEAEQKPFAMRDESLPPPRPGKTLVSEFPPPSEAEALPASETNGTLQIVRHMPEGDVPIAPHLSLTFSQPMVPVTSLEELTAQSVPVKLSPAPPGKWRWVGTKTLLFEPTGRFPMSTIYHVEVPAGTKSTIGGIFTTPVTWNFSTPPVQLTASSPVVGPTRRDVLLFAAFDQKIDAAEVLKTVRVQSGSKSYPIHLAASDEVASDVTASRMVKEAEGGRWLAFRTDSLLAADAQINVVIGPGAPSAEGPRTTAKPLAWSFRTYGPMRVVDHRCGWGKACPPFTPWQIQFSNPIDAKKFSPSMVAVQPNLPGMKAVVGGQYLTITGRAKGRMTYRVTLSPDIPDEFGQILGAGSSMAFTVSSAPESLAAQGGTLVILDPAGPPKFPVYTINRKSLKVSLYAVEPLQWGDYLRYMRDDARGDVKRDPPGRKVFAKTIPIDSVPDELTESFIDLTPALQEGLGQVVLIVEPAVQPKERWRRQVVRVWIQVTRIGLDAFIDNTDLCAWVSSLKDGRPLGGVDITLQPSNTTGKTRPDGMTTIPLRSQAGNMLVARLGKDLAILPQSTSWWDETGTWMRREPSDDLRWFVFDDRKMYRPGEEVRIKGWIRQIGMRKGGDVDTIGSDLPRVVSYTLFDSQRNTILEGMQQINSLGGFDLSLKLPPTMNLGEATVKLALTPSLPNVTSQEYQHSIQVQEFRRPEYEVSTRPSDGPYFVGDSATITVSASYYAGGALPNADVTWNVTATKGQFTPPNRDDFIFGTWKPWWDSFGPDSTELPQAKPFAAHTDSSGKHTLRIDFDSVNPPTPSSLQAEATVMDVNRQAWTASTTLLVHPSTLYVGIKSDRMFVRQGESLRIDSIVTDLNGKATEGRQVTLRLVRLDWVQEAGEWIHKEVDPQDHVITSSKDPVHSSFQPKEGGTYRLTARVMDDGERYNQSEMTLWVAGGKMPPNRNVEREKVTLVPDKKEYRAGETAEILVMTPFAPCDGVLTLRRSGIVRTEHLTMQESSRIVKVKIEESYTPNIHVQIDLSGAEPRTDDNGNVDASLPPRPAYASGSLNLAVPPIERSLALSIAPRESKLEPGGQTVIDAELHDAAGKPVAGGELAIVVVDESVLSLTGYRVPDPLSLFYTQREADVRDYYSREHVLLARPDEIHLEPNDLAIERGVAGGIMPPPSAPMAAAPMEMTKMSESSVGAGEAAPQPIRMRTDFNALALFSASVPTDTQGRAQVAVKVPDNLTRYRIMAVAVAGRKQFGSGESTITARLPLMVRSSPPRFLNFGDQFELPIVVQNQTDKAMPVDIVVRASNAVLTQGVGRHVLVPANDRVEVRFPAAAVMAGTARFQIGAISGKWADANEFQFPVWTPATAEAFATYGQIDEGPIAQSVKIPKGVVPQFGGLDVTTSSTALQALTDAVLYLVSYPFECSEQLASRVMSVAALRDVLTAFDAEGMPKPDEMVATIKRDIERLRGLQNTDGGFSFWRRGDESWPYISIHVAHALERAHSKGFDVPSEMLDRSSTYMKGIEKKIPLWYPDETRWSLIAYALYVRNRMGDNDAERANKLIMNAGLEKLPLEAVGWLLPVLTGDRPPETEGGPIRRLLKGRSVGTNVDAIRRLLANRVEETAGAAHFVTSYRDGAYLLLHSNRRTDGVLLEALIGDQPQNDIIPKLVAGLLAHRTAGHWSNTQENAFILLALDRYFNSYEKVTPDFMAQIWLGGQYAGGYAFKGHTTERYRVDIPMKTLIGGGESTSLLLARKGEGRLYYRIGMTYAPSNLKLPPADYGFTVERRYEAVDKKNDVNHDADGVWHIKAGARVRVLLTMVAPARRYHVALVDPLPAGLEIMNPELAVTGSVPSGLSSDVTVAGGPGLGGPEGKWWWWTRPWFEHENMRDERVEAFTPLLWEGVYTYSYVARATTPGNFVVPPPKAEEMYAPETFGRGAGDRVIVED